MKPSTSGQRAFEDACVAALRRAWTDRLGLRVEVLPDGGDTTAELYVCENGARRVLWSQRVAGVQLPLPLGAERQAPAAATSEAPPPPPPQPVENPVEPAPAPVEPPPAAEPSRFVLFSVTVDDTWIDSDAWAVDHEVRWITPGPVYWHVEGGAKAGHVRQVCVVEREFATELLTACDAAELTVDARDLPDAQPSGSSVLCVGRPVVDDADGRTWYVTALDPRADRLTLRAETGSAEMTCTAEDVAWRWLSVERVHQWAILRTVSTRRAKEKARAAAEAKAKAAKKKAPAKPAPTPPAAKAAATKKAPTEADVEARRAQKGYADRGVVFIVHDDDYLKAARIPELNPSKGGIGCQIGGDHKPWALYGPVDPTRTKLLAAIREGLVRVKVTRPHALTDSTIAEARAWLADQGMLAPVDPAKVKPAKGKGAHRHEQLPAADQHARHGAHVAVILRDGAEAWEVAAVRVDESAPAWRLAVLEAAKGGRVRLYDRSPRCVWDALDGGSP